MVTEKDLNDLKPGHYWAQCGERVVMLRKWVEPDGTVWFAVDTPEEAGGDGWVEWSHIRMKFPLPLPSRIEPVQWFSFPPMRVSELAVGSIFRGVINGPLWVRTKDGCIPIEDSEPKQLWDEVSLNSHVQELLFDASNVYRAPPPEVSSRWG